MSEPASAAGGVPLAEFRPMGLGLRRGNIRMKSSLPRMQRLAVFRDGLEVRNLFDHAWVRRDQIVDLYRITGGFRVVWDDGEFDCSAIVSDWFRASRSSRRWNRPATASNTTELTSGTM